MIVAWRFVKERHAQEAFSGEGARRYGGRWNHRGIPVVYVAEHLSLAILEQFVHLAPEDAQHRFVYFRLEIPEAVRVETVAMNSLPTNWREYPAPSSTQDLGTRWATSRRAAVLHVPSAVVPFESNYALNPYHPDFLQILISDPQPFSLDPRMWK